MWEYFESRYSELIPEFNVFVTALDRQFPVGIRLNTLKDKNTLSKFVEKTVKPHCLEKVFDHYYFVHGERKYWGGQINHHLGFYFIQGLSSLLPVQLLDPRPGERVLDMCSAPGGKSTHMAAQMMNSGVLVVNEPNVGRGRVLKANMDRMGIAIGVYTTQKGEELVLKNESFDRILLDGPCSSEGTFRKEFFTGSKRREVNYIKYNKQFRNELHCIQKNLFEKAYALLKKGGTLVYSTCTYDPKENEAQVTKFLQRHPDCSIVDGFQDFKNLKLDKGVKHFEGEDFHPDIQGTIRVYPHHLNTTGFYVAKIIKSH